MDLSQLQIKQKNNLNGSVKRTPSRFSIRKGYEMKKKIISILSLLLCICTLLSSFSMTAFALSWDGSSGGGAGNGKAADVRGFAVRRYPDDNCLGYRFSI